MLEPFSPDVVIPLGPNCRNSFNVRSFFQTSRAYPFDWWIAPSGSVFHMLEPGFRFQVEASDLVLMELSGAENTVYNRQLHILHHHDFPRLSGKMSVPTKDQIDELNSKYQFLFARMHADIEAAKSVLFVSYGLRPGMSEVGFEACETPGIDKQYSIEEADAKLKFWFGDKFKFIVVNDGDSFTLSSGNSIFIKRPDDGVRTFGPGHSYAYAEPLSTYRRIFEEFLLQPVIQKT